MKKALKLVEQWKNKLPTDATLEEVKLVIGYFFDSESIKFNEGRGSHQIKIEHQSLRYHPKCFDGILTIPIVSGRYVKNIYIKWLLNSIELIEGYNREK
jgi:hypothetical protein